ncbi:MAG: hypothetical protein A3G34_09955 [Candidatus Lindowbacteria bacterium RIFCSPLOWO2_12_FULL_62_27]|nr:MAG: hypothetical protein A3G34_09955 [Candidatus Lindowbacteria bacterium RIFCSPLOWO2_12_FULL_62_27]OGH61565.1 MAG: hypothetical protein A3I06_02965 [Candidatus Lindowbacteria bacterium RIFCSPLOWO2_02_FULL_62_12]
MPCKHEQDVKAGLCTRRPYYLSVFLSILIWSSLGSSSLALTPREELQQILNQIPAEWWNGGWDKLAELESFIQAYPDKPELCATAQFYIGAYYNGVKQYEKSVEAHQTLLTKYPTAKECVKSLWEIGYIQQHRLKNLSEALQAYKRIINQYGESAETPKAMLAAGIIYHRAKQPDVAIQTYQDLIRAHPEADESPRALLKTGIIYREVKKRDQELQPYEQVLQTYGHTKYAPEAKLLIGEYHMRAKDHEKAIAIFQEMIQDYPSAEKVPEALINIGVCYREQRKWKEEMTAYQEVLKKYGNTEYAPRAKFEMGECYQIAKDYNTAIEVLRDLIWKYPKSEEAPRALLKIGLIYRQLNDFDQELATYQKVVEHFGSTKYAAAAQLKIGGVYQRAKKYEKAIEAYGDLVSNVPDVDEAPRALMNTAECYLLLKDPARAIRTFQQVSESYPTGEYAARAKLAIGRQYLTLGEVEKARAYLSQVVSDQKLIPGRPLMEARLVMGDIARSMGERGEAFGHYKEAYREPYHNVKLLKEVIEKLYHEFYHQDRNYNRANRFIAYQAYGPTGEDGAGGTTDDLKDPLIEDALEAASIIQRRNEALSQEDLLELLSYLLPKIGKFEAAEAASKEAMSMQTSKAIDPTVTVGVRVTALKQLVKNVAASPLPMSHVELYREAIWRKQQRYRDIIPLVRQSLVEYGGATAIREVQAEAENLIANAYELLGDLDRSIQEYEILANNAPTLDWELFWRFILAELYIDKGEDEKGISIYRSVIQNHFQHENWPASAHFELAIYFKDIGEVAQARKELQEIVAHYPKSAWFDPATINLTTWK